MTKRRRFDIRPNEGTFTVCETIQPQGRFGNATRGGMASSRSAVHGRNREAAVLTFAGDEIHSSRAGSHSRGSRPHGNREGRFFSLAASVDSATARWFRSSGMCRHASLLRSKKGRGGGLPATTFFNSNLRLIATMRSRSKKGEVGLCYAQSCVRPEPIAIMVLPTVFNRKV
jgi:hypothetical protein